MNAVRILAAATLFTTALVHLSRFFVACAEPETPVIVAFGAVYAVLGMLLLRRGRAAAYGGVVLPLIGLVLATRGMLENPSLLGGFFITADAVIVVCCIYLLAARPKSPPGAGRSRADKRERGVP